MDSHSHQRAGTRPTRTHWLVLRTAQRASLYRSVVRPLAGGLADSHRADQNALPEHRSRAASNDRIRVFPLPARIGALDGARRILAIRGPQRERTAAISALNRATDQSTGCPPGAHDGTKVPGFARVHVSISSRYR